VLHNHLWQQEYVQILQLEFVQTVIILKYNLIFEGTDSRDNISNSVADGISSQTFELYMKIIRHIYFIIHSNIPGETSQRLWVLRNYSMLCKYKQRS